MYFDKPKTFYIFKLSGAYGIYVTWLEGMRRMKDME
jgi:hypothetical protein